MAIFSRFCKPESVPEKDFPMEIPQYEMEVKATKDAQIVKTLVESDEKINIYEKIQADNHGLDVYDLIKRFTNGDPNVKIGIIDWKDGNFEGTTMSLVEMQSVIENAAAEWEGLPLDIRQHYDNDLTKFLNGVDTGELNKFMAERNAPKTNAPADKEEEK